MGTTEVSGDSDTSVTGVSGHRDVGSEDRRGDRRRRHGDRDGNLSKNEKELPSVQTSGHRDSRVKNGHRQT